MKDLLRLVQRNAFVAHVIDRMHDLRSDQAWLARQLSAPTTRFVPIWNDRVLVGDVAQPHLQMLDISEFQAISASCLDLHQRLILLGQINDTTYFGVDMEDACAERWSSLTIDRQAGKFCDLREIVQFLEPTESALAAQATAIAQWHHTQRFCGRCGSPVSSEEGGYVLRCVNPACGQLHFPRVDPAVIVRVTAGDRCLLGHQARWPRWRYSNVAGFVEPGESLETAVLREVQEETGIKLKSVQYYSSQPWPFPRSLMVGFTAEAASLTIDLHDGELADARWFTREEIIHRLQSETLELPPTYSISFHLIEDWFQDDSPVELRDLLALSSRN